MLGPGEFLLRARLRAEVLETWIEAGWLMPRREGEEPRFSELDLARAWLIRDLTEGLGVNEEGVDVALGLLDQVHGLRAAMRRLCAALQALPEPLRREVMAALGAAGAELPPDEAAAGEAPARPAP